jgi:hypothetical protein
MKASWIIWMSLDLITFTGMAMRSAVNGLIVGAVIGATIVTALAFKYGASGWTRLDRACLSGAVLAIGLWWMFDSPEAGILTSACAILVGSLPTWASAWKNPHGENKLAWTLFWVSCVFGIVAIPQWTIADAAQPMTFFIVESVMMLILFIRPLLVASPLNCD